MALIFLTLRKERPASILGPAAVVALLIHTSVPGVLLALSLAVGWAVELRSRNRVHDMPRLLVAVALICTSLALVALYIRPPADSAFAMLYSDYRHHLTMAELLANTRIFFRVIFPIPEMNNFHFWNTNLTDEISPKMLRVFVQYPCSILCLGLAGLCFVRRSSVFALFVVGTLLIAGFAIVQGQLAMRHQGQWFLLVFICFWLSQSAPAAAYEPRNDLISRVSRGFRALVFVIQPLALVCVLACLLRGAFGSTGEVVQAVESMRTNVSAWATYPEGVVSPVSLGLDRDVFSLQRVQMERFTEWKGMPTVSQDPAADRSAAENLKAFSMKRHRVVLFMNEGEVPSFFSKLPTGLSVRELVREPAGIVEGEVNVAYLVQPTENGK